MKLFHCRNTSGAQMKQKNVFLPVQSSKFGTTTSSLRTTFQVCLHHVEALQCEPLALEIIWAIFFSKKKLILKRVTEVAPLYLDEVNNLSRNCFFAQEGELLVVQLMRNSFCFVLFFCCFVFLFLFLFFCGQELGIIILE